MTKLSLLLGAPVQRPKSKAAQLAELLPDIEAALVAGHTHRAIFEHVKKTIGLDLTFGYYENTIHRIRQRKDAIAKSIVPAVPTPSAIHAKRLFTPPAISAQAMDVPTSKSQEALSGSVHDFFS